MTRRIRVLLLSLCVCGIAAAIGCPLMNRARLAPAPAGTNWTFANEQDWIATSIARAVANIAAVPSEQVSAKTRSPEAGTDALLIVDVALPGGSVPLTIRDHIWAPPDYVPLVARLTDPPAAARAPGPVSRSPLAEALLTPTVAVLQAQNEAISRELAADLRSPGAHERAALLVGAFALREAAGEFSDVRLVLGRMTAHLAVARALRADSAASREGELAEIVLLTLVGRQRDALNALERFGAPGLSDAERAWTSVLRLRNTEDWRLLPEPEDATLLEQLEGYRSVRLRLGRNRAFDYLERVRPDLARVPDWTRITLQASTTVEGVNRFSEEAIPREVADIGGVYLVLHGGGWPLPEPDFVEWLNRAPAAGPVERVASETRVAVIDEGTWAFHAHRHLAMQLASRSACLRRCLGLPDEADAFDASTEQSFGALTLYPLVRRQTATTRAAYEGAVRRAAALIDRGPELVTMKNWKTLLEKPDFAPLAGGVPTERRWFVDAIPAGTTYDSGERIIGTGRNPRLSDAAVARIREQAPYRRSVLFEHVRKRYGTNPSAEALERELQAVLPYDLPVAERIARAAADRPDEYVRRMTAVCELDPDSWGKLGTYLADRGRRDEAVTAFERWFADGRDRVGVSNGISWLVDEYLRRGNNRRAAAIAQAAGRVYSWRGLMTLARALEATGYIDAAERAYSDAVERYGGHEELLAFYSRRGAAGDARRRTQAERLTRRVFEHGLEKAGPGTLAAPASDGVKFTIVGVTGEREGMRAGDIVVAVDGVRVRNVAQYRARRGASADPIMRLTVWRINAYVEVAAGLRHEWPYSEIVNYAAQP